MGGSSDEKWAWSLVKFCSAPINLAPLFYKSCIRYCILLTRNPVQRSCNSTCTKYLTNWRGWSFGVLKLVSTQPHPQALVVCRYGGTRQVDCSITIVSPSTISTGYLTKKSVAFGLTKTKTNILCGRIPIPVCTWKMEHAHTMHVYQAFLHIREGLGMMDTFANSLLLLRATSVCQAQWNIMHCRSYQGGHGRITRSRTC